MEARIQASDTLFNNPQSAIRNPQLKPSLRKTTQLLAPAHYTPPPAGQYDIYPAFPIGEGKIQSGFESLAEYLSAYHTAMLDGFGGVLWEMVREQLDAALRERGVRAAWIAVDDALLAEEKIDAMIAPFLGGDDPLWGTRFTGTLGDFFDRWRLAALAPSPQPSPKGRGSKDSGSLSPWKRVRVRASSSPEQDPDNSLHQVEASLSIIYGSGAALAGWSGPLVYFDVPKNEIQFRSRAGSIRNLGARSAASAKAMYKRFYFVDWPALNRHKQELLPRIDAVVDEQRPGEPLWMSGDDLRAGLSAMSRNCFRARPWFEPGPWGGQWIKEHIPQLPPAPNYAWSFELISPENGLIFESGAKLLEVSFDFVMYHDHRAVLGNCADRFGVEFPIRFDFLDTFDGGNLSVQCHPRPDYIRKHFGESFTQDETYYILDCGPGARVYLGFTEECDPQEFRSELERSRTTGEEIDVERFVNTVPARKHDLLLIPHGTIHCSGRDNLVLEISATPYIFTFKMYDWVRRDLDGSMRPLNIERAFENLYLDRTAPRIREEFISTPRVIAEGDGWRVVHLPTHPDHFYDVRRYEFDREIAVETGGDCHVLNLVEGESIILETTEGLRQRFNYAETFIVPAAAGSYRMINEGSGRVMVVGAFVKSET